MSPPAIPSTPTPANRDQPPFTEPLAHRRGRKAEDLSADWLSAKGLQLLGRNLRVRGGEVDLLMLEGSTWVFVEVKYRSRRDFGGASASVDWRKQRRVRHAANFLLQERFGNRCWPACRFDVVLIEAGTLRWIRGAF
ncbi:MAG: YraN family protein [Betaproteobacteria bacterium]